MKRKAYTMTVEEIDAATLALKNQRGAMHFLLPIAPELRTNTRRMLPKAVQLAEKRLKAAREHVEDLPVNFDLRNYERDVGLMKALDQCCDAAARLHAEVQDTLNQVGGNASLAGAEAYAHLKVSIATSPGLQRSVGALGSRRAKSSKSSTPDPKKKAETAQAATPQAQPPVPDPDKKAA